MRAGVARLAIESGAPIVPVTIGGAMRAWPKWKLLPRPAKIVVRYHDPIRLSEEERAANRDSREFQRQVTERVATSVNRSPPHPFTGPNRSNTGIDSRRRMSAATNGRLRS